MGSSFHEDLSRTHEVRLSSARSFGLWFAGIFTGFGVYPLLHRGEPRWWLLALAAVFLAAAWLRPAVLNPLNVAWSKVGLLLAKIVNPIVMAIVFFGVITPLGALMRLGGKQLLGLKPDPNQSSYWIHRNPPGPDGASMARQY